MHRAAMIGLLLAAPPALAAGPAAPPPPPPGATVVAPAGTPSTPPPASGTPSSRPSTPPPPPPTSVPPTSANAEPVDQEPVDLTGTWTYTRGSGQSPRYVRAREDAETSPNPEGYYSGVSIDGNHVPPFPARSMGTKPALMTWTGFERVGEGSRVFFELSSDVATEVDVKGSVITVRLRNTKINVRNNARSLDLRYFRTPVRSVKVTRKGRDAVATIVLKRSATPSVSWIAGKANYRLLVVEFAAAVESDSPGDIVQ